ncbi:MAG: tRNA (adenosine(37)-N6)-dimethylallyltransferase MiaA [Phycisphaeraceae bacterium]
MSDSRALRPIVILGPTAGGKSELAVGLAERLPEGGEVLGADSMQVYRQLDAGTAKPEPALRARVPHHLIDIVEPTERFTVADWVARADALIVELQQRGRRPIVVGGTNLYLKVLLEGMFDAPAQDPAFRASLEQAPTDELHRRLGRVDPAAAERIHANDRKRIVRALEVHHVTGRPISDQQRQWFDQGAEGPRGQGAKEVGYRHDPVLIGLDWPAEAINRRINQRVKRMFFPSREDASDRGDATESLPEEVRRLEAAGVLGAQAREALGYKQMLAHLHGRCTLEEAFEQTKIQTRRFARQQRTWLRRFRGVHWLPAAELEEGALVESGLAAVRQAEKDVR